MYSIKPSVDSLTKYGLCASFSASIARRLFNIPPPFYALRALRRASPHLFELFARPVSRIYVPRCMAVEFDTRYAVGVVVFTFVLFSLKNVLEIVEKCMRVLGVCLGAVPQPSCLSMHYGQRESVRTVQTVALLLVSTCKPLVLIAGALAGEFALGYRPRWTVFFVRVLANHSDFAHTHAALPALNYTALAPCEVQSEEVDGLFVVMPFALLSAVSTFTWISLKNEGVFDADPPWDAELFSSKGMQVFEILYGLETYTLLFSLLAVAGDPVNVENTLLTALCMTLLLLYLFACSRSARSDAMVDGVLGVVILLLIAVLVSWFLAWHAGYAPISMSAAVLLVAVSGLLALLHVVCKDDTPAGNVILYRTLLSSCATIYFAVLAGIDSNSRRT